MKFSKITYRALQNTGNYCSEALELEALLEDGDNFEECFKRLVAETKKKLKEAIALKNSDDDIPW